MKAPKIGLVLFLVGTAYMIGAGWLAMWWVAPIWRDTPPEQFEGTIWAFGGPVFIVIAFSVPVGILLAALGIMLYSMSGDGDKRPILTFAVEGILVSSSMLFPSALKYYPVVFGIAGGLIYAFFFATLWYWAKNRRLLESSAQTAADLQLASYIFFLLTASLICSQLGNPYSGLFFPEKVVRLDALPWHYCTGTKIALYFVLGWLFSFLSQHALLRGRRDEGSI